MRHFALSILLLLLLGAVVALWRCRFERVENLPPMSLADLKRAKPILPAGAEWGGGNGNETLRLTVNKDHPRVSFSVALPGISEVEALHVRIQMAASNLTQGKQIWDDGRVLIEWRSPDGMEKQEVDPLCSLRGNASSGNVSLVARPFSGASIPILRVEHLGRSGEFEISKLEWTAVRERAVWKFGQWILGACWFVWIYGFLSGLGSPSFVRKTMAAGVWVVLGIHFVVPGPWKSLRPLLVPFELGTQVSSPAPKSETSAMGEENQKASAAPVPAAGHQPATKELGRVPPQGNWLIRIKLHLARIRPLLHGLLLFGPTVLFAFLVGQRRALILAAAFAVAIEAAQTAFGYGFDHEDVFDLISNGLGVTAGIIAYRMWPKLHKRLFARG